MLCSPVSSGQRKIRALESSGRRKERGWHLCTSMANLLVSDDKPSLYLLPLTSPSLSFHHLFIITSDIFIFLALSCPSFPLPSSTGSYAGRAKIEGATLTIHSVTQKDSGEYRCELTASEDHVNLGEATVTLNVLGMTGNQHVFLWICTYDPMWSWQNLFFPRFLKS